MLRRIRDGSVGTATLAKHMNGSAASYIPHAASAIAFVVAVYLLFGGSPASAPLAAEAAGSQTHAAAGTYTFSVPAYTGTLTVQLWGAGGAGEGLCAACAGQPGGNTSWNGTVFANGGGGGTTAGGGAGGTASGSGPFIASNYAYGQAGITPTGGSAPYGGAGGGEGVWGISPGGGGGGYAARRGGGSGGYATVTYGAGALAQGTQITIVVGAGGKAAIVTNGTEGGNGADGKVVISWTDAGASSGAPIMGYAWSDTIGWIDLNCANKGTCGAVNFGLSIDASGVTSGYAWSENIGWVSAHSADLAGCPIAPCEARVSGTIPNLLMTGWLKAIAANAAENGGWDGFIRLSSTGHADGVSYSTATGQFAGYAWGAMNVGWVSFAQATSSYLRCTPLTYTCNGNTIIYNDSACSQTTVATCVSPAYCSPGSSVCLYPSPNPIPGVDPGGGALTGHLQIKPQLVAKGGTVRVFWNIDNVSACTVTGTNGQTFTGITSGASGQQTAPIMDRVDFTLVCTAADGAPYRENATVNLLPVYRER